MEGKRLICEFTNAVDASTAPELLVFLALQGIPWDIFKSAPKQRSEQSQETGDASVRISARGSMNC